MNIVRYPGFLRSGKVGILSSQEQSGKTQRVREKLGNFKIPLTRLIIYALFSQFLLAPRPPTGALPQHLVQSAVSFRRILMPK